METKAIFNAPLCERLDVRRFDLQAGMGFVADSEPRRALFVPADVGCFRVGSTTVAKLKDQIRQTRALADSHLPDVCLQK
jgi:hypothetical protein